MNVSISNVVADLDTTVENVQLAITAYMLVMASTMLLGGKLGDIWSRRRAFRIGLVVFAIGSGLTAVTPGIGLLLFGWSLVEGLGAAIMVPALIALIASTYEGQRPAQRDGHDRQRLRRFADRRPQDRPALGGGLRRRFLLVHAGTAR